MITIDGSSGEGGGQILRTSLALSMITQTPFRIERIRANREKPGLQKQHLTGVLAAQEVSGAEVVGAALKSQQLTFIPQKVKSGAYRFAIGTAGSTTLVLQTVLPALILAPGNSSLILEGGTHNDHAPPYDFLARTFLPVLNQMGPKVVSQIERPGFYPAGGGSITVEIQSSGQLHPLHLKTRGECRRTLARAVVARLPRHVADRELAVIEAELGWTGPELSVEEWPNSMSPGNAVLIELESHQLTELFSALGAKGVPAETVARNAVKETKAYLASDAAVGEHLADQLLLPMALAGGGSFTTVAPSLHTRTNIETIQRFLPVTFTIKEELNHWVISCGKQLQP